MENKINGFLSLNIKNNTFKNIIFKAIIVITLLFNTTANAKSIVLKDIRTGVKGNVTRIVLDLSGAVEYKVFTLSNPYRVVLDSSEFKSSLAPQISLKSKGAVRTVRYGTFRPNVNRTVMDLRYPVKIISIKLYKGSKTRLEIDLKKSSISKLKKQKSIQSNGWNKAETTSKKKQQAEIAKLTTPTKKGGKPLIIIDAGHGGPDPGSIGVGGVYEKRIALEIAKAIVIELKKTGKLNVSLTRSRDVYIPLRTRYRIAEKRGADFFISIHADKHSKSSIRGMSVYTLSNKSSDIEASRLARKENQFDKMIGVKTENEDDIKNILIDISQAGAMNSSSSFANQLVKTAKHDRIRLLKRPHRFAGFAVLKSPHVPSVLIETGYMSNKYDVKNLTSRKWRAKFAKTISKALIHYFKEHPITP